MTIAGPGEDILKDLVKRGGRDEGEKAARLLLVDRATSAAFLICLLLAIHLAR